MSNLKYIQFKTAQLAKQIGYNNSCDALYHKKSDKDEYQLNEMYCDGQFCQDRDLFPAPKQQELETWLRDELKYYIIVWPEFYQTGINWNVQSLWDAKTEEHDLFSGTSEYGDNGQFKSFEDALEFGLVLVMCIHILGKDINQNYKGTAELHEMINEYYPNYWRD